MHRTGADARPDRAGDARRLATVAVLVDLERRADAGGHVKFWERLAQAAAAAALDVRLELHFQGRRPAHERLSEQVHIHEHPPLLSSRSLRCLSVVPDHTDLAPLNPRLLPHLWRADLLHTTDGQFAQAATARLVARLRTCPLVTSLHTQTAAYGGIYAAAQLRRWLGDGRGGRWLLERLRPGERLERRLQMRLQQHLRRCAWVLGADAGALAPGALAPGAGTSGLRRGLDRRVFRRDPRAGEVLGQRLGIPPQARVLAYSGRLSAGKRVLRVARLARELRASGHDVHAVFAGAGEQAAELRRLLGAHGHLLGHVTETEVAAMLSRADLFVFPSQVEVWPNAVAEAMACAVPVLVSAAGGGRLLATSGVDGLIIDEAPGAWLAAAAALLADRPRARRMGLAGRERVDQAVPDWRTVLEADLLPVWQALLGSGQRRGHDVWARPGQI